MAAEFVEKTVRATHHGRELFITNLENRGSKRAERETVGRMRSMPVTEN